MCVFVPPLRSFLSETAGDNCDNRERVGGGGRLMCLCGKLEEEEEEESQLCPQLSAQHKDS